MISLAGAIMPACSSLSTPTSLSASASSLPFRAGNYLFSVVGADSIGIGSGPIVPGCPGRQAAGLSARVETEVLMEQSGAAWVARPKLAASGAFELRFVDGPHGPGEPGGGTGVGGTATGTAINTLPVVLTQPERIDDSRALFGADVTFSGGVSGGGTVGSGLLNGAITFSNSQGVSVSCNPGTVSWLISRIG